MKPNSVKRTLVTVLALLAVILIGPFFSPYNPKGDSELPTTKNQKPSLTHVMGTDNTDRDLFSRVLQGSQTSAVIAIGATALALSLGSVFALTAALTGGPFDTLMQRANDVALAVPRFLVLFAITAVQDTPLRPGQLILLIGLTGWFDIARLTRGEVAGLLAKDWVLATQATGIGKWRLAFRQIFPHLVPMLIVMGTLSIGRTIVLEAGLSFLGPGSTGASLGNLLHDGWGAVSPKWWLVTFPGLALVLIVLACNALGDALRDVFAPEQVHAWPTT